MIYNKITNYLLQNLEVEIDTNLNHLKNGNFLFNNFIEISYLNQKNSSYNFSTNNINIPKNFFRNQYNSIQYSSIEKVFHDKSLSFIIFHEVGHLNNHQFLSLHFNQLTDIFEYITLNSKSNYIKTNTSLDNLFDRALTKDNPIDDFIHMNFTESYADAYAGLVSYIQDKDISIFDKIHQFRTENINKLKTHNGFNPKLNDSSLEITAGKFSISRYHNIDNVL